MKYVTSLLSLLLLLFLLPCKLSAQEVRFDLNPVVPEMEVIPEKPASLSCFYLQPDFQVGSLMGVGAAVGGYISNFNVEAFFTMGLAKSEEITWKKEGKSDEMGSYKPMAFGARLGYGFTVGAGPVSARRLRLTPQVGLSVANIKCSCNNGDSKGYAASATIGLKGEYVLSRNIAIFAAPEVAFAVTKSDIYKQLEDVSSKIKGWGTGFNARLGVTVSF